MDRDEIFEALDWQPADADADSGTRKHALALVRAARVALRRDFRMTLKELPDAMDKAVYVLERFPLVVDVAEGQATRFLKYQRSSVLQVGNPRDMAPESLRRHLVGALQHGTLLVLDFDTLNTVELEQFFSPETFRARLSPARRCAHHPCSGNSCGRKRATRSRAFLVNDQFRLVVVCQSATPPPKTALAMCALHVHLTAEQVADCGQGDDSSNSTASGTLAKLLGVVRELKRNSIELVEAAFDGDLETVTRWLDKNYDIKSEDGHAHTALLEAVCQGHNGVVRFLLAREADPNKCNDEKRSPLYRAEYNGHLETAELLLSSGADPRVRTTQADTAFDVAKTPAVRELLATWETATTDQLVEARRYLIEVKWHERIVSHVEREQFALRHIHQELLKLARAGDATTVAARFEQLAEEALAIGERPRASADIRDEKGSTLLAVAAQHDHHELVSALLTKWRWYAEAAHAAAAASSSGPQQQLAKKLIMLAKMTKANVNARDCRGWTPVPIAVFHEAKRSLRLLLARGADPKVTNQYNKSAYGFAKDELDAAMNVVKSRAEIRQVLVDWENERRVVAGGSDSEAAGAQVAVAPSVAGKKSKRDKKPSASATASGGKGTKALIAKKAATKLR
ncbi:hypothetical protein PybrP1_010360 [[Pythium] brassicae (nom. inval.)]|nr:hypothetical protein PybrP1_010360 [[Pythium] brassicae (nom. inval.)]